MLRIFDSTFAITYALQAIAIVVALLGIVGTLMTLVIERRRELGILRAVGASRGQVRAMIVAEAAMLGTISQVAGRGARPAAGPDSRLRRQPPEFWLDDPPHHPWTSLLQMSAL